MANVVAKLIATGGFVGYFPIAPGTAGSAVAGAVIWLASPIQLPTYLCLILLITAAGIWASTKAERTYGTDSHKIVVDEMAGMMVASIGRGESFTQLAACFLIFRIFDIFKPFPINRLQNFRGGWGVMADDVVAGIYTSVVVWGYLSVRGGMM